MDLESFGWLRFIQDDFGSFGSRDQQKSLFDFNRFEN